MFSIAGLPEKLGRIYASGDEVKFQTTVESSRLNGKTVTGEPSLRIGDEIQFGGSAERMLLIQVSDG